MLKGLINNSKYKLLLPFYHLVLNDAPSYIKHLYKPKTIRQFKEDLEVFLTYYQPISLTEVIQANKGKKKIMKPSFHLTFDDGLYNFYDKVAPILLEKGIPATIFLNTDFVGNKKLFFRYKASLLIENYLNTNETIQNIYHDFVKKKQEIKADKQDVKSFLLEINFQQKHILDELASQINYNFAGFLETQKPYLNITQIKELQEQGFTFGAHSVNHPLYAELSLEEQISQTKTSLNWIKSNIKSKQKSFSFPFHDTGVSKQFFNKIANDLDISFGTSGIKKDEIPFHLHRLDMEKSSSNTKQFLINEYLKRILKAPLGKNSVKRH